MDWDYFGYIAMKLDAWWKCYFIEEYTSGLNQMKADKMVKFDINTYKEVDLTGLITAGELEDLFNQAFHRTERRMWALERMKARLTVAGLNLGML